MVEKPEQSTVHEFQCKNTRESLIQSQRADPDLRRFYDQLLTEDEAEKVRQCFMIRDGLLVRKYRPPSVLLNHHWECKYQIVVPRVLCSTILRLAHDIPTSAHLGVKKTKARILDSFWWPTVNHDVAQYVKTCHTCQKVGKPNQGPRKVPLHPIPVMNEAFEQVISDIVGPLPKTSSAEFLHSHYHVYSY